MKKISKFIMIVILSISILNLSSCFYVNESDRNIIIQPISEIVNSVDDTFAIVEHEAAAPFNLRYDLYIDYDTFNNNQAQLIDLIKTDILEEIYTFCQNNTDKISSKALSITLELIANKNSDEEIQLLTFEMYPETKQLLYGLNIHVPISFDSIKNLSQDLNYIDMSIYSSIQETNIDYSLDERFPNLKRLYGLSINQSDDFLYIKDMTSLTELKIYIRDNVSLEYLAENSTIKELEIYCLGENSYDKIDFSVLKCMDNLSTLVIYSSNITEDEKQLLQNSLPDCKFNFYSSK